MPLTRYWVYEPDALCSRPLPNADDLEPAQVYLAADVERAVEQENIYQERLRGDLVAIINKTLTERDAARFELEACQAVLAAKEREANEREIFYADILNEAERTRVSLCEQLAAQSASLAQLQKQIELAPSILCTKCNLHVRVYGEPTEAQIKTASSYKKEQP